jgi:hypothetical protein
LKNSLRSHVEQQSMGRSWFLARILMKVESFGR